MRVKLSAKLALIPVAAVVALMCASCGPQMRNQPSIQPYERRMPQMPTGTVPTGGRLATLTQDQSRSGTNPLKSTPDNIARGRIYYGYYCLMCHGDKGNGDGPVGQSYVPKPTDLTNPAVGSIPAGELYSRMLNGVGHSPILIQTVLPEHRWPIVLFVKTLSKK